MAWLIDILNLIGVFLDWIIYSIATTGYVLFATMCEMNLSTIGESLSVISSKIQSFLGIVMLFVVAFNLLKMIVEPDNMEKTASDFVRRIAISIVLLVSMNFIFNELNNFQSLIIQNQVIEKIILGVSAEESSPIDNESRFENYVSTAKFFSYNLFFSFYRTDDGKLETDIMKAEQPFSAILKHPNAETTTYQYPFISGICGILLIVMFVSFALDIGVRSFTLMILQVLAPIPIIAYIAPKGKSILGKYAQTYLSCYLELFIKLAIIYLTLYFISIAIKGITGVVGEVDKLSDVGNVTTSLFPYVGDDTSLFFKAILLVVVMVSLFRFSKKLPTMIGGLFGLNIETSGLAKTGAALGAILGGAAGLATGTVGGAIGGIAGGAGVTGTLASAVKGGFGGLNAGRTSKGIGSFVSGQKKNVGNVKTYATGVGERGGLARSVLHSGTQKLDNVVGFFAGDKRKRAENQRAVANNNEAIEINSRRAQVHTDLRTRTNNLRSTARTSTLRNLGYNSEADYIEGETGGARRYLESLQTVEGKQAYINGQIAAGRSLTDAQSDYTTELGNAQSEYNTARTTAITNLDTQTNNDMNNWMREAGTVPAEFKEMFDDLNSYVSLNSSEFGGATISDLTSLNTLETSSDAILSTINNKRRTLEQTANTLKTDGDNIGQSRKTAGWAKTTGEWAEDRATNLGHGPSSGDNSGNGGR